MKYYMLNPDHSIREAKDIIEWATSFEGVSRFVAKTSLENGMISTVFLGIDHNWGNGKPLFFETMVFDGPLDGEMARYHTWDEALQGHKAMVERVREGK